MVTTIRIVKGFRWGCEFGFHHYYLRKTAAGWWRALAQRVGREPENREDMKW